MLTSLGDRNLHQLRLRFGRDERPSNPAIVVPIDGP
jgi:hypothetical protein